MKRARAHAAVANIRDADEFLFLQPRAQQDAGHHGNHVAEVGNRTDKALFHIAEMDVEILAARWTTDLRHVLREDVAWANAFYEDGAQIAYEWSDDILRLQRVSAANRSRFLAQ